MAEIVNLWKIMMQESGAISNDGAIRSQKGTVRVAADRNQLPDLDFEKSRDDILNHNNWTTQQPQGQKEQRNQCKASLLMFPNSHPKFGQLSFVVPFFSI